MNIVVNKWIPFKGYKAVCIWPFIFVREECKNRFALVDKNHEKIHAEQQKELYGVGLGLAFTLAIIGCGWWSLLVIPLFLWWYGIEYLIRLIKYKLAHKAYENISFEQEAYTNEKDMKYLQNRKHFVWTKYL